VAENTEVENQVNTSPAKKKGMSFALSAIIVGIGLIITKGSGLIRDVIVSLRFSDGVFRDAYTLAFNIPDLFYNLLVGGAIYSTVAPYLSAQLAVGKEKEGVKVVSKFITAVCLIMLFFCTIGTVFSEPLYVIYSLFHEVKNPEIIPLAAQASKFLFPQIFFIMLAALCNGILISYRKFTITSFAPVFYNILVIAAIFFCGGNSLNRLMFTTFGILLASVFYFLFQYTLGFKQMKQFRFDFHLADRELMKLTLRAIPILISASVVQINNIVLNSFALQFDEGSVFAFRSIGIRSRIQRDIGFIQIAKFLSATGITRFTGFGAFAALAGFTRLSTFASLAGFTGFGAFAALAGFTRLGTFAALAGFTRFGAFTAAGFTRLGAFSGFTGFGTFAAAGFT
jgi:putative peptidoglycan lipid II flippase